MTMKSPHTTVWNGEGVHALGKRKTRNADGNTFQPTPPRTRMAAQLPTPDTGRRTSKRIAKPQLAASTEPIPISLPTPQTLPRKRKTLPSPHADGDADVQPDPSPSGHTTFFMSYSDASTSRSESMCRRRPGLTFAQQMAAASSQPSTGKYGVGVGMRGARTGGHQVDKIVSKPMATLDDNPFIIPGSAAALAASPGRSTTHRPALISPDQDAEASPRTRSRVAHLRSPPMIVSDPVHSSTSLLSPPGTSRANRIRSTPTPPSPGTIALREKSERLKRMRDEDENPFLVKPGQRVVHRPRPVVDETKETVTYVFRGAKKIFANPFIPHDIPVQGSDLDVEDEDFEPHPCPPPRLLWPTQPEPIIAETPRRKGMGSSRHSRQHRATSEDGPSPPSSPIPMVTPGGPHSSARFVSDDEFLPEGEEEDAPVRRGLLFGPQATIKTRETQTYRRPQRRV